MKPRFFSQKDPRWTYLARYHAKSADALQELDEHIFAGVLEKSGNVDYQLIWEAYGRFTAGLIELLGQGMSETSRNGYTIYDYGCWDCTISMIVDQLDGYFYEYGSHKGLDPTPITFIHSLRSWQVLSVIGFSYDIVVDPVSVVTQSQIQMVMHADYGARGVSVKDADVLNYALSKQVPLSIAVCVKGHSILGSKADTHWVAINPAEGGGQTIMRDPSCQGPSQFSYRRVYEICVYSTPDNIPRLLQVKEVYHAYAF